MKYVVLLAALALALYAGICEAADQGTKTAAGTGAVPADSSSDTGLKHIDLGEEPVTSVGTMDPGQNYDGNTGFPNVTQSDSNGELGS